MVRFPLVESVAQHTFAGAMRLIFFFFLDGYVSSSPHFRKYPFTSQSICIRRSRVYVYSRVSLFITHPLTIVVDNLGDRCQEEEKRKKGCLCNACPFKAELRKLDSIYGEMMTLPPLPSSPSSPSSSSTHMDGPDSPPPDQRLMSYADPFGQDGHSVW